MKNLKKIYSRSASALLALVMILACVCSLGLATTEKTSALVPNYPGDHDSIYYFSDSLPILDEATLSATFPNYTVTYDHHYYVDTQVLWDLYTNNYFSGLASYSIFVLELKTFKPSASVLQRIFSDIVDQDCTILFVSPYVNDSDYSVLLSQNTEAITTYQCDPFDSFPQFVSDAFDNWEQQQILPLTNTFFLLDSRYVDFSQATDPTDIDTLSAASPFLRFFLEELYTRLSIQEISTSCSSSDYQEIFDHLIEFGIRVFVHANNNNFVDLADGETYAYDTMATLYNTNHTYTAQNIFVFGIWSLNPQLYSTLKTAQTNLAGNTKEMRIYVWEYEPIVYSPNGLVIISHFGLSGQAGSYPPPTAVDILLDLLSDMM